MRRIKFLFDQITDFDNIRLAWLKARRGKAFSYSVIKFKKDVNSNLEKIRQRLLSESPQWGKYRQFIITDPKERIISAASFEERIMHHAIMNVLEPVFERQMIYHTYACRKDKGTHRAVQYAFRQTARFGYALKLDIRKYFDSINHSILEDMLCKIIKDIPCIALLRGIIRSYNLAGANEAPRGLPIGNLTSQFFANLYLSSLDHFILEKLHAHAYCRYMDDMLVFGNSKDEMRKLFCAVENFCSQKLKLDLKIPLILQTEKGIPFLGYVIRPDKIKLQKSKFRAKKAALKRLEYLCETGLLDEESVAARMNAICNVL